MSFAVRYVVFVVVWWSLVVMTSFAIANDEIRFDVPVLVEASKVPSPLDEANERLVEISIPVSTLVIDDKVALRGFNFDVHWNRNIYPLVNYAPKTSTQTEIDGNISVEQNQERSVDVGLNSSASVAPFGTLTGNASTRSRNAQTLRFKKIPEHQLLVASGTIQRGTGAFFRFYPSKQFTLEGGRELSVTFRVPQTWRGGVMRVVCSADGSRTVFAGIREPVSVTRTFIVPTYLKGDEEARQIAVSYAQNEIALRRDWTGYRERLEAARPTDLLSKIETALAGNPKDQFLDAGWATELIESGTDRLLVRHQRGLPELVRESAVEFVESRQMLYSLSR